MSYIYTEPWNQIMAVWAFNSKSKNDYKGFQDQTEKRMQD